MRRLVLLVVALFLLSAAPASAGGPTSVLITSPAEQRAAALYNNQLDYIELTDALGPATSDPAAPDLHGTPGSNAVNITWLIHDVQVWRVDHVFLTADGGPWVETYKSFDGVDLGQRGSVHRPANPEKLVQVLDAVLGEPAQNVVHPARPPAAPDSAPVASAPAPATGLHWTSLVIGLVGGAVLVVFGRVVFGVVRRRAV